MSFVGNHHAVTPSPFRDDFFQSLDDIPRRRRRLCRANRGDARNKAVSDGEQERLPLDGKEEGELARLLDAALMGDEKAYAEFLRRAAAFVRGFARRRIMQGGV